MNEMQKKWKSKTLLFLISQCITLFGSMLVQMAVVWYVTLQTSSGIWAAAYVGDTFNRSRYTDAGGQCCATTACAGRTSYAF